MLPQTVSSWAPVQGAQPSAMPFFPQQFAGQAEISRQTQSMSTFQQTYTTVQLRDTPAQSRAAPLPSTFATSVDQDVDMDVDEKDEDFVMGDSEPAEHNSYHRIHRMETQHELDFTEEHLNSCKECVSHTTTSTDPQEDVEMDD